jgi:hypothetical protein
MRVLRISDNGQSLRNATNALGLHWSAIPRGHSPKEQDSDGIETLREQAKGGCSLLAAPNPSPYSISRNVSAGSCSLLAAPRLPVPD